METPKNLRQRPTRNPTPRLSERKKSLFATAHPNKNEDDSDLEQENNVLDGLEVLSDEKNSKDESSHSSRRSVEGLIKKTPNKAISFLKNNNGSSPERMCDELFEKLPDSPRSAKEKVVTPTRRSCRLSLKPQNRSPTTTSSSVAHPTPGKENIPRTPKKTYSDELQDMFENSMNLNKKKKSSKDEEGKGKKENDHDDADDDNDEEEEIIDESSSENEDQCRDRFKSVTNKRSTSSPPNSDAKIRRLNNSERRSISTKSFYSSAKTSPTSIRSPPTLARLKPVARQKGHHSNHRQPTNNINRGVHHSIKKKPKPKAMLPSVPKKDILSIIRNEKLRNLLTTKRQEKDQIESVHKILKTAKNPIEMAKPLSVISSSNNDPFKKNNNNNNSTTNDGNNNTSVPNKRCYMNDISMGFSDIECSSESEQEDAEAVEEVLQQGVNELLAEPEERSITPVPGRKFFKSGNSGTKKEVKITDNIRASVCNGKLSIMPDTKQLKKKKKLKLRDTRVNEFSSEQARVDEIIKNFEITIINPQDLEDEDETQISEQPSTQPPALTTGAPVVPESNQILIEQYSPAASCSNDGFDEFDEMRMTETEAEIEVETQVECSDFRRRLPYNTNNPELIERQHILLDFMETNKICTEENFKIFIADPENHKEEAQKILDHIVVIVNGTQPNPDSFRERLPYNTSDPAEIEQQKSFLEFLIENDMCNEENFEIFISDYANRQEEADRIITEVVASTHNISAEDLERELNRFNKQGPEESMDVEIPDQNREIQKVLEASPEKLFPVFYPGRCQPIMRQTSTRKIAKTWIGGQGADQYQIDAGQKKFGARYCKQCGLLYTVNEPEEEKLHKEYHASLYVLKFKSWIDEDIVQIYTEWGFDGRILRLNENSHVKRLERLRDVLKLVDKELGFYSYIMPTVFVAYFAVRHNQIAGVCLVEPLTKANRYVCVNGVDCCTEEFFDAKCGISRIWVSPLHRRFRIATKLIRAVQQHTIFGEEIPLEKIAFSAPTDDGKRFARSVTKIDNFLVYQ
ncbi:N-acetyltransferase eco [Eupeodes corollae]|uniref:N-acetyltransferase eco n=1 Tax=Eupeodes corollae TaxID=290404 RepID=UPI002493167C|nr:N-acetyltransferase eco [Eupeodes corollae]